MGNDCTESQKVIVWYYKDKAKCSMCESRQALREDCFTLQADAKER